MKRVCFVVTVCFLLLIGIYPGSFAAEELLSVPVDTVPEVDGVADDVWADAPETTVSVIGGANNGSTNVSMKSVHTEDMIYFLFTWADPTESVVRFPWKKQSDGTWEQLRSPDNAGGDENTYYEDKFAIIWNINNSVSGFNQAGCMVTCHAGEPGKPYGNKYTASPGEVGDIWHWKGVRTNPVGQIDDQYVDSRRYDANTAPEAGRHSDPSEGGGYSNNVNAAGDAPAFTSPTQPGTYWILDAEKIPFVDTYDKGDEIAGIVTTRILGDRGDISGKGVYADGAWALEIGRLKETGSEFDVQFSDALEEYYFGVAAFDNAQVRHGFQTSVSALTFVPTPTAVDARNKLATTWGQIKVR